MDPEAAESWRVARKRLDLSSSLAEKNWFHSFRLPDGRRFEGHLSLEELESRLSLMPIPMDLSRQRVLDIGAWDGWFSFEMERRGAEVVALDCVEVKNFLHIHKELGSKVDYRIADFQNICPRTYGRFDIVLFLSVLYHLKHPLLALEKVCALTSDLAVVSSFITDDYTRPAEELLREVPRMEFYETDELGGQMDNWFGPNLACLMALCRAAGFARVELLSIRGPSATLACYRRWLAVGEDATDPPVLRAAVHSRNYGTVFDSEAEEYLSCWFQAAGTNLTRDDIRAEVAGNGVRCVHLSPLPEGNWQANFRLPPGLDPGEHEVTIRVGESARSNACRITIQGA